MAYTHGLYVIGAISSLGKTTFIQQIADQMAEAGEHIIFFSLEQSKFELVAKSISRETAKIEVKRGSRTLSEAKTNNYIMSNKTMTETEKEAVREYQKIAGNINIIEGNFDMTVKTIRSYIQNYITLTGYKPIVVIDYLQILKPLSDRLTDKQAVDFNIAEIKRISRDNNIPIFVICSFNRDNYINEVSFEAFKESGAIEYSADVVMGLQLSIISEDTTFNKDKGINEKRKRINEAKSKIPRDIDLVCMKNRNGKSYFRIHYQFYSPFNYFIELRNEE